MKRKILSVVISLFIISFAVTSCLNSDEDNYEYSSDATIHAFEIDSIYSVCYKFTIDQINRRIFNVDSLPHSADTLINKILITKFTTAANSGYFVTGDTLFSYTTDSLDLSKTMAGWGGSPLLAKVYAPDGETFREYAIEVRIHQQDPDSIVWKKLNSSFSGGAVTGNQKSVVLGNRVFVYVSDQTAYASSTNDGKTFTAITLTGLPADVKLSSAINYKETIYMAAESGDVYTTTDGSQWSKSEALSGSVVTFLSCFDDALTGIVKEDDANKFAVTDAQATSWNIGQSVPDNFPTEEISSTLLKSTTGLWKSFLVGKVAPGIIAQTVPWFTFDGLDWADLETPYYYLPYMEQPYILYYNDLLYSFGEPHDYFYSSEDGLIWRPIKKSTLFPEEFLDRGLYSSVVDGDGYIWMIWSKGDGHDDEVWKGRINRVGFAIK